VKSPDQRLFSSKETASANAKPRSKRESIGVVGKGNETGRPKARPVPGHGLFRRKNPRHCDTYCNSRKEGDSWKRNEKNPANRRARRKGMKLCQVTKLRTRKTQKEGEIGQKIPAADIKVRTDVNPQKQSDVRDEERILRGHYLTGPKKGILRGIRKDPI